MGRWNVAVVMFVVVCATGSHSLLVDDVRSEVQKQINETWRQIEVLDREGKSVGEIFKLLAGWIKKIPQVIGRVERELTSYDYETALQSLGRTNTTTEEWKHKWSEISVLTSPVDVLYGHFKLFPDMPTAFVPGAKVMDFDANTITDLILKPLYDTDKAKGAITFPFLVEHAHMIATTGKEKNAFDMLHDYIDESLGNNHFCLWNQKTPQRIIYGFYVSMLTLDIKEYTLKNFAWMISNIVNQTETAGKVAWATATLNARAEQKYEAAYRALSDSSPAFWRCDPEKHVEGETFEQFKELLQGYIENEVRMQPSGSCKQSCGDFGFTKAPCLEATDEACREKRICTGNLVDCTYIAADATVCLAERPRRFDYIRYKRGPWLGQDTCKGVTERRDSYWRFLYHCSNCFCLCDDPKSPSTVRSISLLPAVSDIESNKIVTGIRFVMKDGVLHIQVEEGVPERNGFILDGSTEWKKVPTANRNNAAEVLVMDYINRALDLDDVILIPGHVVTGVRFRQLGSHINLEVQATQIDASTGELKASTAHWLSNDNTPQNAPKPRDELVLSDPDIPTRSKYPSVPDSVHDQYVKFGASSRTTDVSQTTVPFIDIQPVRPQPPVWLQGVGIYHKGQSNFGGFVAPRVFTWSVTDFFREHLSNPK